MNEFSLVKKFCVVFSCAVFITLCPCAVYADPVSTPSDADIEEVFTDQVFIEGDLAPDVEAIPYEDSSSFSLLDENYLPNAVRFDAVVDGVSYILYFPSDVADRLSVDQNNRLWNVSTSNVVGRAFESTFDPLQDEGYSIHLTPSLGNNFSTLHEYGSPNYLRHYYYSSTDRLTYSDRYVVVEVQKSYMPYLVSDNLNYILLFLLGGVLLCLLRRSLR